MSGVLRRMNWSAMSAAERDALCRRGLDAIFDPVLRSSISALIEDVRARGDEAVCEALARHDGIELEPGQLRVGAEEISSARVEEHVEDAIIDAISHLRAFNDHLLERASDWQIEIENGLVAGEKVTPISSAGLFVPSGTQANQIAIRCLTEPGDEVILEETAHPFLYEAGGPAVISGVMMKLLRGERGVLTPEQVRAAVRPPNVHHAVSKIGRAHV